MQLEDGKTYRTRNGKRTFRVSRSNDEDATYPFLVRGGPDVYSWTSYGEYYAGGESPDDLVEEVPTEAEVATVAAADNVNHPPHYNQHPSGVECITVTEHLPHNVGNVVKYLWRAGLKENAPTDQDYNKAVWYLLREMRRQGVKLTVAQDLIEGLR